jgi:hypothetical protein
MFFPLDFVYDSIRGEQTAIAGSIFGRVGNGAAHRRTHDAGDDTSNVRPMKPLKCGSRFVLPEWHQRFLYLISDGLDNIAAQESWRNCQF